MIMFILTFSEYARHLKDALNSVEPKVCHLTVSTDVQDKYIVTSSMANDIELT